MALCSRFELYPDLYDLIKETLNVSGEELSIIHDHVLATRNEDILKELYAYYLRIEYDGNDPDSRSLAWGPSSKGSICDKFADEDFKTIDKRAAQCLFLKGWLEVHLWENGFYDIPSNISPSPLPEDQFFKNETLDYSVKSMRRWHSYYFIRVKMPELIDQLQDLDRYQKELLRVIVNRDDEIEDIVDYISGVLKGGNLPIEQENMLNSLVKSKKITKKFLKSYFDLLKDIAPADKAGLENIHKIAIDNIYTTVQLFKSGTKNLRFHEPEMRRNKSENPWEVFGSKQLRNTYYDGIPDDLSEITIKCPGIPEELVPIRFSKNEPQHATIVNFNTWQIFFCLNNEKPGNKNMNNSIYEKTIALKNAAAKDQSNIPEHVLTIINKIENSMSFSELSEQEKNILIEASDKSPKVKRKIKMAQIKFIRLQVMEIKKKASITYKIKEAFQNKIETGINKIKALVDTLDEFLSPDGDWVFAMKGDIKTKDTIKESFKKIQCLEDPAPQYLLKIDLTRFKYETLLLFREEKNDIVMLYNKEIPSSYIKNNMGYYIEPEFNKEDAGKTKLYLILTPKKLSIDESKFSDDRTTEASYLMNIFNKAIINNGRILTFGIEVNIKR
jgi:hypothetical protein